MKTITTLTIDYDKVVEDFRFSNNTNISVNKTFLEDFCKTLDSKADVLVYLSSTYEIDLGDGEIFLHRDVCGNHHAKNWIEAIDYLAPKTFVVKSIEVECTSYVQYIVTLDIKKCDLTKDLSYLANRCAINSCFS